ARGPARRRTRDLGPAQGPQGRQGRGLHGAPAEGVGRGRRRPDQVASPVHGRSVSPARRPAIRGVAAQRGHGREPRNFQGRLTVSPPHHGGRSGAQPPGGGAPVAQPRGGGAPVAQPRGGGAPVAQPRGGGAPVAQPPGGGAAPRISPQRTRGAPV